MVRPSGLAKMVYGPLEQAGELTVTRVMSYTYDPLGRLVDAARSAATGESFEYQYDAAGNPVSLRSRDERPGMGDQHHAAERYGGDHLYLRVRSLPEHSEGTRPIPSRCTRGMDYRMTAATIFTQTTRFTYPVQALDCAMATAGVCKCW